MKRVILTAIAAISFGAVSAQKSVDTVYIGSGYAKQTWYSLPNDEQGNAPKAEWDLAFDVTGFGSTILVNSVTGTTLWAYPKSDLSSWAGVDTTGLSTWEARYNADTSWAYGAMGKYADAGNPLDLDWGLYNMTTHIITGDSLYIIKLASGDYKKLAIISLSGGIYTFKYENLDGSSPVTATLDKSKYSGKNFGYYSLQSGSEIDREPASASWDLLFTQYTTFIPTAYTVTGVLANKGISIAKCALVTGKDTFVTWKPQTFNPDINTIGYNWKTFTGLTYKMQDSLVYFIARSNGEIWKMIFTDFGGSANGGFMFSKEKLYTPPATVIQTHTPIVGTALYPNPSANGQNVTLVYNMETRTESAKLSIYDMAGRTVLAVDLENSKGLHQYSISPAGFSKGVYQVIVNAGTATAQQRLIIQ